ncbi:hypothetical protein B0H10DRAFT_1937891 [Mycena sp. CBHHK59/15]|nr:hypothetical protein B0H10DRAFT_1937891 [Mycena sp. CBHHK59/15]
MSTLFLAVATLLCISATLNGITMLHLRNTYRANSSLEEWPLASELPISIGPATLEFIFGKHYNIADEAEWATLIPPNQGRVKLGHPRQEFDIAMYSDLRCLDTIRAAYVKMRDGASIPSPAAEECLGQIRQAILCTADITLEPTKFVCHGEKCAPVASGEYLDHKCRNWVQVREFVEENQVTWDKQ